MKPFLHAQISAKIFGGHWKETLPIHDMLDSSKAAHPTMRHRAVFHSDLGVTIAQSIFAPSKCSPMSGVADVGSVAIQHIEDDLGRVPTIAEWAQCLRVPDTAFGGLGRLGRSAFRAEPAAACVARWGGTTSDYQPLIDWFAEPELITGRPHAGLLLQNSFGLFVAERVFGSVIEPTGRRCVSVREIGETLVLARYGIIPSLDAILRWLVLRPWMYPERTGRLHVAVSSAFKRRKTASPSHIA
jgi:hypothetical protein